MEVPYLKNPSMCQKGKKLHTYPVKEWCGMVFVYFHADGKEPEFQLPEFVCKEMEADKWVPFMKWDTGFVRFSPIDFVDQAGDHAHFQTLHNDFMVRLHFIRVSHIHIHIDMNLHNTYHDHTFICTTLPVAMDNDVPSPLVPQDIPHRHMPHLHHLPGGRS
jgi:hypothetical protein